ncbi:M36 family metallopeptidase [Dokdonella sp.]|uniref:M36 family metallopeptidase n=1 Tax=Dokdonella sp. TaxID=2291710 RepID=UPI001AFD32F2|nr:M36 family metallopeptidase [Dokdonella sp.]MBO9664603.1 M36 family metallopeptidase [Dokdonella sp.]
MPSWIRAAVLPSAIAAALGFTSQVSALGNAPPASAALTRGVKAPEAGIERADGRYSTSGVPISLYRPEFTARVAAPEAMAREFLASRAAQLGLSGAQAGTLVRTSLREGRHFSVVRFTQSTGGLPVYGSDIAVTVKPNGRIVHVANASVQGVVELTGPAAKNAVASVRKSANDAVAAARQYLGLGELRLQNTKQMVFVAADGSNRIVWRVNAIGRDTFTGDWEVLVDANSGDVLLARDRAAYVDGTGTVHAPDPLSHARATYGQTGYVDGNNADTQQLTDALVTVTLPNITQNGANYELSGPYMVCANIESPNDAACPSQPGTDFSVTRSAMTFDAVMAYYHISTYLKYVNQTLGVTAMPRNHPGGVHVDPHGFSGQDNSRYSPSGEDLSFGQGGVDDAQDADVLIHELGHGIHDWVTGGHLSQTEGLSEGTGDYLAGAYSRDFPDQWTPADTAYNWVYSWDGHNPFWAGRVLNYQTIRTYAQARTEAIHSAGQYWSSCNLEARKNLQVLDAANGGSTFDKAFLEGLSTTGASTNQKDAAQAVIDAAATLGYTQAQIDAIATAYNSGNQGGNTGCTYAVTVPIVTDDPVVRVDPTTLEATAEIGASVGATLAIGNAGGSDLTWNIDTSDDASCATPSTVAWLSAAPTSGTVAQGAADTDVAVTLDSASLAVGEYTTNLCVHSNDPATAVVAVPVTFTVDPPGDEIFKDGFDGDQVDPNIVDSGVLDIAIAQDTNGLYINWLTGATCSTASGGGCGSVAQAYDFNAWGSSTLNFFWGTAIADTSFCVGDGTSCTVLASGAEIGPSSTFDDSDAALFRTDGEKYLGFSFVNTETSAVNYGYVKLTTTGPNGTPATLNQYWYNKAGEPIVIP